MANIKTRDAVKGTIKTIDKAAIAGERMKSAYAKTKDKAEQGYYAEESFATEYASDKVSYAADRIKDEGMGCTIRLLSWRNELKMQNYEEVLLRWKLLLWRMFIK